MVKVSPSILSCDFARLGEEVNNILEEGADYIHCDVMDGEFVANMSFGMPIIKSLRKVTKGFLDVHLMIDRPVRYVEQFCAAGADLVNVHVEADTEENTQRALDLIHACGVKAGVTVSPGTPAEAVLPFIKKTDLILVMTVVPGQGGQKFMREQTEVLRKIRGYIDELNPACELEADGGINAETAHEAVEAGANVLVAGSAVFGAEDRAAMIARIRG